MSRQPSLDWLATSDASGTFRFRPGTMAPTFALPQSKLTPVAVAKARDKAAFLAACAQALGFPSYFGHNWDAFYDALADLATDSGPVSIIVFDDLSGFARTEPEEFAAALGAMIDAAEFWREHGRRLIVLVGLDESLTQPELPELSLR